MLVLDTSSIIDARIFNLLRFGLLSGPVIVSQAVLDELARLASSKNKLDQRKGKRGLKSLKKFRKDNKTLRDRYFVQITPSLAAHVRAVDQHLLNLAKERGAVLVTSDQELGKKALASDVRVLNINQLAASLRPAYLPGQRLTVLVLEKGEKSRQGVGYLDDGTMVVVKGGEEFVGQSVNVKVNRWVQMEGGVMVFGSVCSD